MLADVALSGLTAIAFIREKTDSTLDRIFAAGIHTGQYILAHYISNTGNLLFR
jgi:hypothetical protein